MLVTLKDGTEVVTNTFTYGKTNTDESIKAGEPTDPFGSFCIDVDGDADIQRLVQSYIAQFSDDNISEITIKRDEGTLRTYHFTKCTSCQIMTTGDREYIYITVI